MVKEVWRGIIAGTDVSGSGSTDEAHAVAIQADGKIVVAGISDGKFAVARYNASGSLDTAFDSDGKLTTSIGTGAYAYGVSVQSDGKIVAGGYAVVGGSYNFAVARYTSAGALDTTFDTDGKLTTDFGSSGDPANALAIGPDYKIVAAGYAGSSGSTTSPSPATR